MGSFSILVFCSNNLLSLTPRNSLSSLSFLSFISIPSNPILGSIILVIFSIFISAFSTYVNTSGCTLLIITSPRLLNTLTLPVFSSIFVIKLPPLAFSSKTAFINNIPFLVRCQIDSGVWDVKIGNNGCAVCNKVMDISAINEPDLISRALIFINSLSLVLILCLLAIVKYDFSSKELKFSRLLDNKYKLYPSSSLNALPSILSSISKFDIRHIPPKIRGEYQNSSPSSLLIRLTFPW